MSISEICIRRPVFTVMLCALPVVLGIVSFNRIGVDLFPNVELPIITVTTTLRGASTEEMETSVTKPLEEVINTVSGIDELRSTSKEGISQITVQFLLEKNREIAAQEVRDKVNSILKQLPAGTDTPLIDKFDLDASPVMQIAISSTRPGSELTEIAEDIKEQLETVSDVGRVFLIGSRKRAIQVIVDPDKLRKYELSIGDVSTALQQQNIETPGGRVDQQQRELVLRTMGRMAKSADFEKLIITNRGGYPVRISDVGRVEDSIEEPRSLNRLEGQNAMSLIVQKQSGTNTVAVADRVRKRLTELETTLPPDIKLDIVRDQSRFIKATIAEVQFHAILGSFLVAGTVLLFMRDWRTVILASLSIPVSIISAFSVMYFLNLTFNNITMLGLVLAVGIVIDDAIVVHENIFRHMEEYGTSAMQAARDATSEIGLTILATTFSLVVIFLPIAFMQGRVGMFFRSFGIVVAVAILFSMLISLTLTPMLCSRFLKISPGGHSSVKNKGLYKLVDDAYGAVLRFSLNHRWVVVLVSLAVIASTVPLFMAVSKDFIPKDDQSEFEVGVIMPEGYTLSRSSDVVRQMEADIHTLPGVTMVFSTVGDTSTQIGKAQGDVTQASIYVQMIDLKKRDYTQADVMKQARKLLNSRYPDMRIAVRDVAAISGAGARGGDLEFNITGPDLDKLQTYSQNILEKMRKLPMLVDADSSLAVRKPELRVEIDRNKASDLGINISPLAQTLNVLVGGDIVGEYKDSRDRYDVWLRADWPQRSDRSAIYDLTVRNNAGALVPLRSVANLNETVGPTQIERYQRQRKVTLLANLAPGGALGDGVNAVQKIVDEMNLPADYQPSFTGRAKTLAETGVNFLIAFALSLLLMYMILAAQFESFVHPITILLAVPLTIPCAVASLLLLHTPLDIYAAFGMFMLFGIVKKNGIMQVDYTNVLRGRGELLNDAILQANHTRLRPILMTTVMLIAGMIPIALGRGPGAASRASLAKVIIGGQALSLLLSLLVTPVAYSLFDDLSHLRQRVAGWFRRRKAPDDQTVAVDGS